MDKIIVPFKNVRGLGNIVSEKELEDFLVYMSTITSTSEEVDGITRKVYSLGYVPPQVSLTLTLDKTVLDYDEHTNLIATLLDENNVGIPNEEVKFYNENSYLFYTGTTDSNGVITINVYSHQPGQHTYTGILTSNTDITGSVTVTINKITSNISLSASSISITYGNSVTLSGTLSAGSGKSVKIYNGNSLVDTVTTGSGGAFTKLVSGLNVGSHTFTAVYEGDSTYASVTSSGVSVTVTKITPTITLSVPATGTAGTAYTVSGTLANPTTGSVKLYEGNTLIDTLTVTGGNFSKSITKNNGGTYTYYAVYEGDSTHASVTSTTGSIVVSSPVTPASITLSCDKPIMMKDETATITATVLDGNGDPCEGELVSFEVVDGEDLGSAYTDASGEASVYYLGKATGDLYIKAFSADRIISSEIYVEDCYLYDDASSDKSSNYSLTSNASITHNTDSYRLSTTAAENFLILTEDLVNASLEVTLKAATSSASGGFSIKDTNTSGFNNAGTIYHASSVGWITHTNGTYGTQDKNLSGVTRTNYYTFKVDVYSDKMIGYVFNSGGTQLWTSTLNKTLSKRYYCIGSYNNGNTSVDIKKIKIKAL